MKRANRCSLATIYHIDQMFRNAPWKAPNNEKAASTEDTISRNKYFHNQTVQKKKKLSVHALQLLF